MSHTIAAAVAPERPHGACPRRRHRWRRALMVTALGLLTMGPIAHAQGPVAKAVAQAGPSFGRWGVETGYIAADVAPGDDFYLHVNKGWLESASIPAGFPMTGAFVHLMLRTEEQLQAIIDELRAGKAEAGTPARQIADLHASFTDMARRNALGSRMLQDEVSAVLVAPDRRDLARRMGDFGHSALVSLDVTPDPGQPQRYILSLEQSGLGLPGRDYYLKDGEPYAGMRAAYLAYIEGVFARGGVADGKRRAAAVLAFETALARSHWTPEQQRDAVRNRHPMSLSGLARHAPGFDWAAFLDQAGFAGVRRVDVHTDSAIRAMAAVFSRTPLDTLRAYVAFHYLDNHAPLLSEAWADAHFDLHSRRLAGIAEQRPLDKRALDFVNQLLAEPLGKLYAERYFPPESKAAADKLVKFLRLAFRERLARVDWMDPATRREAVAKLDAITTKIGYPDQWHDYSSMSIRPDDLVGNLRSYQRWARDDARAKLKEPVRKWEWDPTGMPQVINAYYNPTGAEIVFPAAILQPPFFDPKADPAVNFGAIGMVIGHEMGHGFDDQGSRYDGTGALRNWWGKAARKNFEARASRLVAQYDGYSPLPGLKVSGQLTLGENIGDLGGMMVAWSGYRKLVDAEFQGQAPVIDGYTGPQRFFLGYGQLWRSLYTDGFLRQATLTDPHSPGEFRVNGVLRNFDPWYEAFGVTPQNRLYLPPEARVRIW